MQAPTTPSGTPTHGPGERACPACGATNGTVASFCWQCYRPFPETAPAPAGWAPTTASQTQTRKLGTILVVIVLTLSVIGGVVFFVSRGDTVALPSSFAGMPVIDDQQTRLVVDTFRGQIDLSGIEGDMALYGDRTPSAALVWIRDGSALTTDAAFTQFASGFNEGTGSQGALGSQITETAGDVTYVCAPVVGSLPATICMWREDDVFWLVFDFSGDGFPAGQDLAVVAHDTIAAA